MGGSRRAAWAADNCCCSSGCLHWQGIARSTANCRFLQAFIGLLPCQCPTTARTPRVTHPFQPPLSAPHRSTPNHEVHLNDPIAMAKLQEAARTGRWVIAGGALPAQHGD